MQKKVRKGLRNHVMDDTLSSRRHDGGVCVPSTATAMSRMRKTVKTTPGKRKAVMSVLRLKSVPRNILYSRALV